MIICYVLDTIRYIWDGFESVWRKYYFSTFGNFWSQMPNLSIFDCSGSLIRCLYNELTTKSDYMSRFGYHSTHLGWFWVDLNKNTVFRSFRLLVTFGPKCPNSSKMWIFPRKILKIWKKNEKIKEKIAKKNLKKKFEKKKSIFFFWYFS